MNFVSVKKQHTKLFCGLNFYTWKLFDKIQQNIITENFEEGSLLFGGWVIKQNENADWIKDKLKPMDTKMKTILCVLVHAKTWTTHVSLGFLMRVLLLFFKLLISRSATTQHKYKLIDCSQKNLYQITPRPLKNTNAPASPQFPPIVWMKLVHNEYSDRMGTYNTTLHKIRYKYTHSHITQYTYKYILSPLKWHNT